MDLLDEDFYALPWALTRQLGNNTLSVLYVITILSQHHASPNQPRVDLWRFINRYAYASICSHHQTNAYFVLQSLSFLFLSLHCLLPTLFTYCITIYKYIRMFTIFLLYFVPCVLLFFLFSPSISRRGYSILFVFLRLFSTRSCYMPTLCGGVYYNISSVNC